MPPTTRRNTAIPATSGRQKRLTRLNRWRPISAYATMLTRNRPSRCTQNCTPNAINTQQSAVGCPLYTPHVSCTSVVATVAGRCCQHHAARVAVYSPGFGTKFRVKVPVFFRYLNFSKTHAAQKNRLGPCSRFDTIPSCDRQTHTRGQTDRRTDTYMKTEIPR